VTRVLQLSVVHKPDDPRIHERECRTLVEAGYQVAYMAPEAVRGLDADGVLRLPLPARPRAQRALHAPAIVAAVRDLRPHVVHVHDPELLALFPLLRPLVPRLVYDMHEYVPQQVAAKHYIPARLRPAASKAAGGGQRLLAALADGVVTVTDEQCEALGARPALRAVLPNYPRFTRFADPHPRAELADERLKLAYIGSLSRGRGAGVMLDVMALAGSRAVLYLGGTFADPAWGREVEARVAGELAGCVRLLGRVPPAEVPDVLAAAEVVWVPAQQTSQYTLPTVATKLYEGLAVGLAALVSDLPGRSELVREERCGIAVPPTVAGHLRGVTRLAMDRGAVRPMGDRGRRAVRERYSWEVVQHRLVDFYAELTRGVDDT
jgi:hypothetical protein